LQKSEFKIKIKIPRIEQKVVIFIGFYDFMHKVFYYGVITVSKDNDPCDTFTTSMHYLRYYQTLKNYV